MVVLLYAASNTREREKTSLGGCERKVLLLLGSLIRLVRHKTSGGSCHDGRCYRWKWVMACAKFNLIVKWLFRWNNKHNFTVTVPIA